MKTGRTATMVCGALAIAASAAQASPLTIVEVGAPAINCVFDTSCTITVQDSAGAIVIPGAPEKGVLQSRTAKAGAGAPAAGKVNYEYRIDMTRVTAVAVPCVATLKVNVGPTARIRYKTDGPVADLYVITAGGLGTISIASADRAGDDVTFIFARPICAGGGGGHGETSYFFGFAAAGAPKAVTAQVQLTGGSFLSVAARAPGH
jgi:hypothetical protein